MVKKSWILMVQLNRLGIFSWIKGLKQPFFNQWSSSMFRSNESFLIWFFFFGSHSEVFQWIAGPWMKCSSPCDGGVRYRDVGCFGSIEGTSVAPYPVDNIRCSHKEMVSKTWSWLLNFSINAWFYLVVYWSLHHYLFSVHHSAIGMLENPPLKRLT